MTEPYGTEESTSASPSDDKKTPDSETGTSDSQAGAKTGDKSGEPGSGKKNAEERISQLNAKIKSLEERFPAPPATATPDDPPAIKRAKQQIKSLKFVDEDFLDDRLKTLEDRMILDTEHTRLAQEYDGEDGRPKYDTKKVEDFMRDKGIYLPEAAYDYMHRDELRDHYAKQTGTAAPESDLPGKPGASRQGEQTMTRETLREKMNTPEWK